MPPEAIFQARHGIFITLHKDLKVCLASPECNLGTQPRDKVNLLHAYRRHCFYIILVCFCFMFIMCFKSIYLLKATPKGWSLGNVVIMCARTCEGHATCQQSTKRTCVLWLCITWRNLTLFSHCLKSNNLGLKKEEKTLTIGLNSKGHIPILESATSPVKWHKSEAPTTNHKTRSHRPCHSTTQPLILWTHTSYKNTL